MKIRTYWMNNLMNQNIKGLSLCLGLHTSKIGDNLI